MKRIRLLIPLLLFGFILSMSVGSALALPTLPMNEPAKLKFTNFERWTSNVNDPLWLDAGDVIEGIFNITTITDVPEVDTTWTDSPGGDELTGHFQFTVTGGSMNPALGAVVSFGLGSSDFLRAYYDTNDDWDPTQANAVARATNGSLYFETLGSDLIEAIARDVVPGVTQTNWWFDLTTNNTGYPLIPQLWPEVLGGGPFVHPVPGGWHLAGHTSEVYLEGSIYTYGVYGWDWRSEDPGYLYATPEPATMLLVGSGLVGLARFARRKVAKK